MRTDEPEWPGLAIRQLGDDCPGCSHPREMSDIYQPYWRPADLIRRLLRLAPRPRCTAQDYGEAIRAWVACRCQHAFHIA